MPLPQIDLNTVTYDVGRAMIKRAGPPGAPAVGGAVGAGAAGAGGADWMDALKERMDALKEWATKSYAKYPDRWEVGGAAAGGAGLGALSSLFQRKGRRNPISRALTGAILGGGGMGLAKAFAGAGGSYLEDADAEAGAADNQAAVEGIEAAVRKVPGKPGELRGAGPVEAIWDPLKGWWNDEPMKGSPGMKTTPSPGRPSTTPRPGPAAAVQAAFPDAPWTRHDAAGLGAAGITAALQQPSTNARHYAIQRRGPLETMMHPSRANAMYKELVSPANAGKIDPHTVDQLKHDRNTAPKHPIRRLFQRGHSPSAQALRANYEPKPATYPLQGGGQNVATTGGITESALKDVRNAVEQARRPSGGFRGKIRGAGRFGVPALVGIATDLLSRELEHRYNGTPQNLTAAQALSQKLAP